MKFSHLYVLFLFILVLASDFFLSTQNSLAFIDSIISSINLSLTFLLLTYVPSGRIVKICLKIVVIGYVFVAMQRVQKKMKMRMLGTCSRRTSKIC